MKTAEQQAREMLDRMDIAGALGMTAGDVVELANLIRDREHLRSILDTIDALLLRAGYEVPSAFGGSDIVAALQDALMDLEELEGRPREET